MGVELKSIPDSEKVEKTPEKIKSDLKLRSIETKAETLGGVVSTVKPIEEAVKAAKDQKIKQISTPFNVQQIADRVLDAIEEKERRKLYYIGKSDKRLFCGPVIQTVPVEGFATIGGGISTSASKSPLAGGKAYKFQKDRQVLVRVGRQPGKDYLLVVGANGCVLVESGAAAVFNMPVFVVEHTGHYYFANHGKRVLSLGPGAHLIMYAKEALVLFVTVAKTERVKEAPVVATKIDSKTSPSKTATKSDSKSKSGDELKSGSQEAPKESSKESPKPQKPEDTKKPEPKPEKSDSKDKPEEPAPEEAPVVEPPVVAPPSPAPEPEEPPPELEEDAERPVGLAVIVRRREEERDGSRMCWYCVAAVAIATTIAILYYTQ